MGFLKFLVGIVSVLLMAAHLSSQADAQGVVQLRSDVTVRSNVVRLGDVVSGLGAEGARPIFRAPAPGSTGYVAAQEIALAALRAGVSLNDLGGITTVSIRRVNNMMDRAQIADLLLFEMADQFNEPLSAIQLDRDDLPASVLHEANSDSRFRPRISDIDYDQQRERVSAVLLTFENDRPVTTRLIASVVLEDNSLVLAENMERGAIINRADLVERRMPRRFVTGSVQNLEALVGQQLRRPLAAGTPVRAGDVRAPTLITRNSEVLLQLKRNGLALSVRGKAMQNGALGDMVDVMNIRSKKIVQGTVQRDGSVLIGGEMPKARPITLKQMRERATRINALQEGFGTTQRTTIGPTGSTVSFEGIRS
jgi:flagella basal body P-ring formation protein FlgA